MYIIHSKYILFTPLEIPPIRRINNRKILLVILYFWNNLNYYHHPLMKLLFGKVMNKENYLINSIIQYLPRKLNHENR